MPPIPPVVARILIAILVKVIVGVFWELWYRYRDDPEFRQAIILWYIQSMNKVNAVFHKKALRKDR